MHRTLEKSFKHKKKFGQHFLKDQAIAQKITEVFREKLTTPTVLEIGPGQGVLTQFLVSGDFSFYISEIDPEIPPIILQKFPLSPDQVILGDFLQMHFDKYFPGDFSIIGNFPYNISSQILFKMLEYHARIPLMVGMFQKEVGVRIASGPGNKDYGILSVLCQAYYEVEYLFTVDETLFTPPPKVKSGVLRFIHRQTLPDCNEKLFYKIVKVGFNQRRKTLRNALKSLISQPDFNHPFLAKRAEQLSVNDFIALTNAVENLEKM